MSEKNGEMGKYLIVDDLLDCLDEIDLSKCKHAPEHYCERFSIKGKIDSEGALLFE